MRSKLIAVLLPVMVLLASTLILQPWRDIVSYDDTAYAFTAIKWSQGESTAYNASVASVWPQILVGSTALRLFSDVAPFRTLAFVTWICFLLFVYLMGRRLHETPVFVLSFFAFPLWFQYGSAYLSEIYSCLLLLGIMSVVLTGPVSFERWPVWVRASLGLLFALAAGLQVQSLAAFPFFIGLDLVFRKRQRLIGSTLIAGSLLAVGAFFLLPKTPYQLAYPYWMGQLWIQEGLRALYVYPLHCLRLLIGIGIFFAPFIGPIRPEDRIRFVQVLAAAGLFFTLMTVLKVDGLTVGILFLDYMPPFVSRFANSLGVIGWYFYLRQVDFRSLSKSSQPVIGVGLAVMTLIVFSAFRHAADLRYVMAFVIAILLVVPRKPNETMWLWGRSWTYAVPMLLLSLFTNSFFLNTSEARWQMARDLKARGVPPRSISAGLGHDAFTFEHECLGRLTQYLDAKYDRPDFWKEEEFWVRIISKFNRSYSDEWKPEYFIKPTSIMGKKLNLQLNRYEGQDQAPVEEVKYATFGVPSTIGVFRSPDQQTAFCDRLDER